MADETAGSGKGGAVFMPVGSEKWAVLTEGATVEFCDYVTEIRQAFGVVYASLGQTVRDGDGPGTINVRVRLRMSLAVAQGLHQMLGNEIKAALTPPDQSKAN